MDWKDSVLEMKISIRNIEKVLSANRGVLPLFVIIPVMLFVGAWLRIKNFTEPPAFIFDENHFVGCARQYLSHQFDWNDHPPLGKLIIAFSMKIWGDNPLGWRLSAEFFGFLTIVLGGIASARLFKNSFAGWLAAAFLSLDGLMITYSRVAHLDIYLAAASAATLLIVTMSPTFPVSLLGGLVCGFALGIKFSGVCLLPIFAVYFFLAKISRWKLVSMVTVFLSSCILVYMAQYLAGLYISGQSVSIGEVFTNTKRLLAMHSNASDWKNPWTSDWFTWAIPVRSIPLMFTKLLGEVRVLSGVSNIALSWTGAAVTLVAFTTVLARGLIASAAQTNASESVEKPSCSIIMFVRLHGRQLLLLLTGCIGFLAPWILSHRDSYLWHYIPSYLFIIIMLGGYFGWVQRRLPGAVLFFSALVLVTAAFFSPVWTFTPISESAMKIRLFWSGWR